MTGSANTPPTEAATSHIAPPETVEELRALLLGIARGEVDIPLGPKARRALGQMLDLQGDPALVSITTLGERLGVNPSTITRLARTLGYPGFGALQEVLLRSANTPGAFYTQQARRALDTADAPSQANAARLCRETQANTDRFLDGFDTQAFDRAVEMIVEAPRLSVYGIRQFHAFASFLVYGLRMIRSDVSLLDSNALGQAEGLAALHPGDVLIVASCNPYSAPVIKVTRAAAEKGVRVLAITDMVSSPLMRHAEVALFAPHETSFISNSLSTFILAGECLINGCAAARPESTRNALEERDRMIRALDIET
ncbi:MurR/RpiR family transcriptional regulator [Rhodovulum adriaticum]|uniref:RpiR family transcriptional regulator n=1 Tax=Rhodovulum adriaticum TaxID=35804 RepID=A0A4R2NJ05_RHOAD|nr:MurR/RpiR family transcriptional regulator [Rhodovulum adriaticum]TCP21094.1 RpiR family transcriptional regulator [Rhodovulum adriaticum]